MDSLRTAGPSRLSSICAEILCRNISWEIPAPDLASRWDGLVALCRDVGNGGIGGANRCQRNRNQKNEHKKNESDNPFSNE